MSTLKPNPQKDSCLMEGYNHYLMHIKGLSQPRAKNHVNLVRKFFNYLGKFYLDVEKKDIIIYLSFLMEHESLQERSIYRHLLAIKKFYEYLSSRGDVLINPGEGVKVKDI